MSFIFVGLLASLVAWLVNRRFFLDLGTVGVIAAAPIFEEILKTGGAVFLGADILLVHACFGSIEAILDINTGDRSISGGVLSFLGHILFGYLTVFLFTVGNLWLALLVGIGVHIMWNTAAVLAVSKRKKGDLK